MFWLRKAGQRFCTRQELFFLFGIFRIRTFSKSFKGKCYISRGVFLLSLSTFWCRYSKSVYCLVPRNTCSWLVRKYTEEYGWMSYFYQSYQLLVRILHKNSFFSYYFLINVLWKLTSKLTSSPKFPKRSFLPYLRHEQFCSNLKS